MRQAVTAWTRWAAARQGVDEDTASTLVSYLDGKLDDFAAAYDDAESTALLGYVQDLATPDVDLTWLRTFAPAGNWPRRRRRPGPRRRGHRPNRAGRPRHLDGSEFGSCALEGSAGDVPGRRHAGRGGTMARRPGRDLAGG